MTRIGLTGGIGSGKSVVSTIFSILGYPCYDSDSAMKRLYTSDECLKEDMIKAFGPHIYTDNGQLDNKCLSAILFSDRTAQEKISSVAYPVLADDYKRWLKGQKASVTLFESAILFQAGLSLPFDRTIAVTAPEALRTERVRQRSGLSAEEIHSRMNRQMKDCELAFRATDVFVNDGVHPILPQVEQFLQTIHNS